MKKSLYMCRVFKAPVQRVPFQFAWPVPSDLTTSNCAGNPAKAVATDRLASSGNAIQLDPFLIVTGWSAGLTG